MKFILFGIVIISFLFNYDSVDARISCRNACTDGIDLRNIALAIKNTRCAGKVNLKGFESATKTVRSLVCKCGKSGHYTPRKHNCIQMYNCNIVIPLVRKDIPMIIEAIGRAVKKNVCKAIQIYMDNISNVFQSCIGGALSFQGDHTEGKQVAYFVDTCYNATIVDLKQSIKRFDPKVPGDGTRVLDIYKLHMNPAREVYYSPEFRECMSKFDAQTIETCDC